MAGLRLDQNNPDLLINFFVSTRETLQTRPSTSAACAPKGKVKFGGSKKWVAERPGSISGGSSLAT